MHDASAENASGSQPVPEADGPERGSQSPPPQSAQPMACGLTSCPICERKAGSGLMEGKDAVREHRELMLLAAADLESWMKSHGKDLATVDTVKRLRAAALSQGQQTEQGSRNG